MTWRRSLQFLARALLTLAFARAAVASAGSPAPAAGVVGTGPGTCDDSALTSALAGGGAITFNCGGPATILLTSAKTIAADTTLFGGDVITLTGNLATRLFNVNSGVTFGLQHILLDRAASTGSDGGAIASAGTLNLDSATIQNSRTDMGHSGGAIFSSGPVSLSNSRFLTNTAGSGGALYAVTGLAALTIRNSIFSNNKTSNAAAGFGGALWVGPAARLTLTDGQLFENSAHDGGALYLSAGTQVTLTAEADLELEANQVTDSGGAIYNAGGSLSVLNASMIGNLTPFTGTNGVGRGGAIFSLGPLVLTGDQIVGNDASLGGGVYVTSSVGSIYVPIERTSIIGNGAHNGVGGGVFIGGASAVMNIFNSAFIGNVAK